MNFEVSPSSSSDVALALGVCSRASYVFRKALVAMGYEAQAREPGPESTTETFSFESMSFAECRMRK